MDTHWSVLSVVFVSPLCHGYSFWCLVNRLFVSMMAWILIGVSSQSSFCLHYVTGTYFGVLLIVYLSPWSHVYSLRVSSQSTVTGTHLECLVNGLFVSMKSHVFIVSCQSSIYLHEVTDILWECLVNRLFVSMKSHALIMGALSIVYFLHEVTGTHYQCIVNHLFVSMMSRVLIGGVLSIVYLSPWSHGYSLWVSCQSSICLILSVLSIVYLSPWSHGYSLWLSCQSSICLL